MERYNHKDIESKWQKHWLETGAFKIDKDDTSKEKYYVLDMFPYPSGDGLHMGHTESYTASDVFYRFKKMQGYNVLHPQGFDAFGLPAENFAIKTGVHPAQTTERNINTYIEQMRMLGLAYDFDEQAVTSDPKYYKWTQWIFGKFFENGLVYKKSSKTNWCSSCQTVIANEQVVDNECERCGTEIIQKEVPSWFFRITDFADDLIEGLDKVDWPEHTKKNQKNWIGKSEGANIKFKLTTNSSQQTTEGNPNIVGCAALIKTTTGKYLFQERDEKAPVGANTITFFSGGRQENESGLDCIKRELLEELDLKVNEDQIKIIGNFNHVKNPENASTVFFVKDVEPKDLTLNEGRSIIESSLEDLLKDERINIYTKKFIEYYLSKEALNNKEIEVFTTRPDTLFGATYMVLSPEHKLVQELKDSISNWSEVESYIIQTQKKTEMERVENKEKTGVKLEGILAVNPANIEEIPIFIADYVLAGYGTGAIMAVPAHDERDFEFAKKFDLSINPVIAKLFVEKEGKDAVRENEETKTRKTIVSIVEHWDEDKYLCLDWEKFGWKSFIIGGVEEGETFEEATLREIKEETGYQNLEIIEQIGDEAHSNFYAGHKGINVYAETKCFHVKIKDNSFIEPEEIHTKNHKSEWVSKKDISSYVNLNIHEWFCDIFEKGNQVYIGEGVLINSGKFDGMDFEEAKKKITEFVGGEIATTYRLRDWSISRQRYWGCPIPIVYSPDGEAHPVPEEYLPWTLPTDVDFVPTGVSPLAKSKELKERTEKIFGEGWVPEYDTMDTFVDSSWYFLRYPDALNEKEFCSKKRQKHWLPVDLYIGGAEHTYMHLLFARFFTRAMHKIGLLDFDEPFIRLKHQGMVLDGEGKKMSKSKGNVVNPNEMVERFGADSVRTYMLFAAPLEDEVMWNEDNIVGVYRFLEKVWEQAGMLGESSPEVKNALHKTIRKVTGDVEELKYNTVVSEMMKFMNIVKKSSISKEDYELFLKILAPFAPHITEEIWAGLGHNSSIHNESWPEYDEDLAKDTSFTIGVQVNGKVRGDIQIEDGMSEDEVKKLGLEQEFVQKWLDGNEPKKIIYVRNKILNIVV